eukprot:jgi/Chrzof1/9557/Cz04g07230.t1
MSMNRDNFRANQPPSKVLHVRNLPPDATEEELRELCQPFGRIIKIKLNAGQSRNQAFVEFDSVNAAIQMVSYFVGNADPPRVRSKSVYLQYSTRQEIGSGAPMPDTPGSVLLVIMDNIQAGAAPTLNTIHLVFSAFGQVAKIALFEKASGLQALVQYKDFKVAKEAQQQLDGRSIPKYLVPQHAGTITMKVSFSAHADLSIRYQSNHSRDYTNPNLPSAPAGSEQVAAVQRLPGMPDISTSNVLLCMIDNVQYTPTLDALHTTFSTYGFVQKLTIFEKNGNWQALVQYPDDATAASAKHYLDGHCMYPGGANKIKLSYSMHRDLNVKHNTEKSWDYTAAAAAPQQPAAIHSAAAPVAAPAAAHRYQPAALHTSSSKPSSKTADAAGDQPVTGLEYAAAHEEVARMAVAVLGGQMPPAPSSGTRIMLPLYRPPTAPPQYRGFYAAPAPGGYYGWGESQAPAFGVYPQASSYQYGPYS